MSLDITPVIAKGRQLIQSYGDGGFKIALEQHEGSVLVFPERTIPWSVANADQITMESLKEVTLATCEILLIGCGPEFLRPPADLRHALKSHGIALEWMDTGAACRTFNILLAEERQAIAALVAVD